LSELVENVLRCTIVMTGPQWRNSILYPIANTLQASDENLALEPANRSAGWTVCTNEVGVGPRAATPLNLS
jgi:hypothetical protein